MTLSSTLFPVLIAVLVAGCATSTPSKQPAPHVAAAPAGGLRGTSWELSRLGDQAFTAAAGLSAPTLVFDQDGSRVVGFAGVNRFVARVWRLNDRLGISDIGRTRMSGTEAAQELEKAFLDMLRGVTGWRLVEGRLELLADEAVVAVLTPEVAVRL